MMSNKPSLIFSVDSKPPFVTSVFLGFQHVLTLFGSTTLVPLIIGTSMKMDPIQLSSLIASVYLGMGICTLLQTSILGSQLPIVQGSSFSFIPCFLAIIAMYANSSPNIIMQYIAGGLIVGGIFQAIVGYTGLIGYIKKVITPVVIIPTIMAIGFSLAGTAINSASSNWIVSLAVVALIFFFSLFSKNKSLNVFSILLSVAIVYLACLFLSGIGIIPNTSSVFIDVNKILNAEWFRGFQDCIMPCGIPKFSAVVFITMLSGFFAGMIESIGDYHSISYISGLDVPNKETISKGVGSEGLGMIVSGFVGSLATTSYTENIGLVNLTGIASRYVVKIGAILLILLSFIGKLSVIIASMPTAVIGGCYIILFALIGSSGMSMLKEISTNQRNMLIIGVSFLLALGLPTWIEANKELFVYNNAILNTLGSIAFSLLKSSMAIAGLVSIVLDNIIPEVKE